MDPLTAAVLKRVAVWWIANRPFSKEKREARKAKRRARREAKEAGISPEENDMEKLLALIAGLRTSTKAGAVGFVPLIAVLPFYSTVNDYLMQACMSSEGPTVFLVGGAVVWVTMFVTARRSKTPTTPGTL